jgi:hypothetical protein
VAIADTARLIASLELRDDLKKGVAGATASVDTLESRINRIGAHVSTGLKTAGRTIGIGIVAAGGAIALGVKQGLDSLATLESAVTSVDGAIDQLGLTGKVTGAEVAQWANQIESAVGAAFDDKDITRATATLIRFGKVTPENIRPAMEVMTDLAAKTGDVDSAAQLLAKALADPEKAAGKLAKAGVVLTAEQQKTLKALVATGDAAGAQKFLLDRLAETTKGAAAATQGPYQRALSTLKDTFEDVERALAVGFLPVIEKVAELLKGKMADPGFLAKVEDFGRTLADALQKALDAAEKLPWGAIGDAMKLAGQGAKAALDLFTGLPAWVQTAVLTGWGLNKLTGGALGGIVGELSKGLIKGILGITAAQVNINAANATLGGPGVAGAAAAEGSGIAGAVKSALGAVFTVATAYLIFKPVADTLGTLITQAFGTKPAPAGSGASLFLSGIPGMGGAGLGDIGAYRRANGLDPQTGLPLPSSSPAGPTGTYRNSEWGAVAQSTEKTAEGVDELNRINQLAANTLKQAAGAIPKLGNDLTAQFVATWGGARSALLAQGVKQDQLRHAIAHELGLTVGELRTLRSSYRSALAQELGITNGEVRRLLRSNHYDEQAIADALGISVDELRTLQNQARTTATNTSGLLRKDWSPTINVPVSVNAKTVISGRTVADTSQNYRITSRPRVE